MPERFVVDVPEPVLDDLRERLRRTRWPAGVVESGGYPLEAARSLIAYWLEPFDWRAQERRLNAWPHFTTVAGGTHLHYVHTVPDHAVGPPLLLLHGWPGSFVELLGVAARLRSRFELVVPSLPGFGFSAAPTEPGMSNRRMADAMVALMDELGHDRFGVHGGDVGAGVGTWMARTHPDRVAGLHLNYIPGSYRPSLEGAPTDEEAAFVRGAADWSERDGAYGHVQRTRPLTLAYGLSDSPTALATWIAEKFQEWTDPGSELTNEEILTNVTVYWVGNSAHASVRLYLESSLTPLAFGPGERIAVPTGIARFPLEEPFPPRSWVERVYDVRRWTDMPRGGHFAAMEAPDLLAADLRAFFGSAPD